MDQRNSINLISQCRYIKIVVQLDIAHNLMDMVKTLVEFRKHSHTTRRKWSKHWLNSTNTDWGWRAIQNWTQVIWTNQWQKKAALEYDTSADSERKQCEENAANVEDEPSPVGRDHIWRQSKCQTVNLVRDAYKYKRRDDDVRDRIARN